MSKVSEASFAKSAGTLLEAVQALDRAAADWLAQAAGLAQGRPDLNGVGGSLNPVKLKRELQQLVLRSLPTVDLPGHKKAAGHARVYGARLVGLRGVVS